MVQDCTFRPKGPVVAGVVVVEVAPAMVACKAGPVQAEEGEAEEVGVGPAVQSLRLLRVTGTHHQPSLWYVCVLEMVCVHRHVFLCGAWLIVDDIVVHVWSSCALSLHCHRLTVSRCQPRHGIIIVAVLACLACQCSVLHSHTQDTGTPPLMVPVLPLLSCYCERQAPIVEEQAPSSQPYMSPFVGAPAAMVPTPSRDTPSMWSFPAPPADSEAVPLTGTTGAVQPVAGAEGTPAGSATGSAPHGPRQAGPEAELDPFPGVVFPEVPMGTQQ
jgi:hypothetical protein